MSVYEDACHGWTGEPVLVDQYPLAVALVLTAPLVAVLLVALGGLA